MHYLASGYIIALLSITYWPYILHRLQFFQNCFRDKPHHAQVTPTLIGWNCTFLALYSLNTESWQHSSLLNSLNLKKLMLIELSYYVTSWPRQPSGTIQYKSRIPFMIRDQGQSPILISLALSRDYLAQVWLAIL